MALSVEAVIYATCAAIQGVVLATQLLGPSERAERGSFAVYSFAAFGWSVCAMGFASDSPLWSRLGVVGLPLFSIGVALCVFDFGRVMGAWSRREATIYSVSGCFIAVGAAVALSSSTLPSEPGSRLIPLSLIDSIFVVTAMLIMVVVSIRIFLARVRALLPQQIVGLLTVIAWCVDVIGTHFWNTAPIFLTPIMLVLQSVAILDGLMKKRAGLVGSLQSERAQLVAARDGVAELRAELRRLGPLAAVGDLSGLLADALVQPLARLRELDPGEDAPQLDAIDSETDRIAILVENLLRYARPLDLQRRATRIADLVTDAWRHVDKRVEPGTDRTLEIRIDADTPRLDVDPSHAIEALSGVLYHARHASTPGRPVIVSCSQTRWLGKAATLVTVRHEGRGFTKQERLRATQPLLNRSDPVEGIAMAARLVRAMNGHVDVIGDDADGLAVVVTFMNEGNSHSLRKSTHKNTPPYHG